MRICTMMVVIAVVAVAAADEKDKPTSRTLELKGVQLKHEGNAPVPTEIKTADDLAKCKSIVDDAGRDAVKKQVDFAKEKLVVFAWSGSGGDKLVPKFTTDGKKLLATFSYTAGETDDLRRHGFVFAVPKEAEVKVAK